MKQNPGYRHYMKKTNVVNKPGEIHRSRLPVSL